MEDRLLALADLLKALGAQEIKNLAANDRIANKEVDRIAMATDMLITQRIKMQRQNLKRRRFFHSSTKSHLISLIHMLIGSIITFNCHKVAVVLPKVRFLKQEKNGESVEWPQTQAK